MKTLAKLGLGALVVAAALLVAPPKQAEAHRYWSYYGGYGPVYRGYYPRRVAYRPYYPRYAYRAAYYRAPVYYGGYYGGGYYGGGYYGGCQY